MSDNELKKLEKEWMSQTAIVAYPNWLQSELLKARSEVKAAVERCCKVAETFWRHPHEEFGKRIAELIREQEKDVLK